MFKENLAERKKLFPSKHPYLPKQNCNGCDLKGEIGLSANGKLNCPYRRACKSICVAKKICDKKDAKKENKAREKIEKQTEALIESNEKAAQNQKVLEEGLKTVTNSIEKSTERSSRSTMIMVFVVIGIAVLILLIVIVVVHLARKGMKQHMMQQEQYMQAFKMIAATQNQTNRLMLGGITDLYGNGNTSPLRLAGTSVWEPATALPESAYTEEEQEELRKALLEYCKLDTYAMVKIWGKLKEIIKDINI